MKCLDRIFSAINFCMIRIYVTYSVSIYNHLFLNYGKKNFHIQNKKRIVVEWVANKWFLSKKVFNIIFSLRYKEFYKHTNYFHPFYPSGLHHKKKSEKKKWKKNTSTLFQNSKTDKLLVFPRPLLRIGALIQRPASNEWTLVPRKNSRPSTANSF